MKDYYLYDDVKVLKNLLNIKDEEQVELAEADITYIKLLDVDGSVISKVFDYAHLKNIHKHIFGDIYEWAGEERCINIVKGEKVLGGDTVRYSDHNNITKEVHDIMHQFKSVRWSELSIDETSEKISKLVAKLWQIHPFREGNTRTVITFAIQFAEFNGFKMSKQLFKENSNYVRDSLVKASDGQYSEYKYLINIIKDAINKG